MSLLNESELKQKKNKHFHIFRCISQRLCDIAEIAILPLMQGSYQGALLKGYSEREDTMFFMEYCATPQQVFATCARAICARCSTIVGIVK